MGPNSPNSHCSATQRLLSPHPSHFSLSTLHPGDRNKQPGTTCELGRDGCDGWGGGMGYLILSIIYAVWIISLFMLVYCIGDLIGVTYLLDIKGNLSKRQMKADTAHFFACCLVFMEQL